MNVVLFGIGQKFKLNMRRIEQLTDYINIVAFCDNSIQSNMKILFNGKFVDVIMPDEIMKLDYDEIIVVTNYMNFVQIKKQLIDMDIKSQIFYYDDWLSEIIKYIIIKRLKNKYSGTYYNIDKQRYIENMAEHDLSMFNFCNINKYTPQNYMDKIIYDDESGLFYIIYYGKKMYFSRKYKTIEHVAHYVSSISMEQDCNCPHRYCDDSFDVSTNDIVIDAGVAEGNFALRIIDRVSKLYLVECDPDWVEALKYTFKDYMNKVVLCEKSLNDEDTYKTVTIDSITGCQPVNFIKMDIEGAEPLALMGAVKTIENSTDLKCSICCYHKHGDESLIRFILNKLNMQIHETKGYLYSVFDDMWYSEPEIRNVIIRAKKDINIEYCN